MVRSVKSSTLQVIFLTNSYLFLKHIPFPPTISLILGILHVLSVGRCSRCHSGYQLDKANQC